MIKKRSLLYFVILMTFITCAKSEVEGVPAIEANNLQEYLNVNSSLETKEMFAFGKPFNTIQNQKIIEENSAYIMYYPIKLFHDVLSKVTEVLYFETENLNVDENDFSHYKRRVLPLSQSPYEHMRVFERIDDLTEVWGVVTYKYMGALYKSKPIKIQPKRKPLDYKFYSQISIDFSDKTKPKFSWEDGVYNDSEIYYQVIRYSGSIPWTGTITNDKWLQYKNFDNVIYNFIKEEDPPNLKPNESYFINIYGINKDNWATTQFQTYFMIP